MRFNAPSNSFCTRNIHVQTSIQLQSKTIKPIYVSITKNERDIKKGSTPVFVFVFVFFVSFIILGCPLGKVDSIRSFLMKIFWIVVNRIEKKERKRKKKKFHPHSSRLYDVKIREQVFPRRSGNSIFHKLKKEQQRQQQNACSYWHGGSQSTSSARPRR